MPRKPLAAAALLVFFTTVAYAAVDINRADQAEIEQVKGIGPALSQRILDERQKGAFRDWADLIRRVGGIGPGNAARFSASGLTVGGSEYPSAARTTGASSPAGGQRPARPAGPATSTPRR